MSDLFNAVSIKLFVALVYLVFMVGCASFKSQSPPEPVPEIKHGLLLGAAVVARLHADSAFRAELESAKTELAAVRDKGLPPQRVCEAEKKALSVIPPAASWPANK